MNEQQRFSQQEVDHYNEHGFVFLRNFLDETELAAVYEAIDGMLPGWRNAVDPSLPRSKDWVEPTPLPTNPRFPFAASVLNEMTFHPELVRFAAEICGHDDFFCEQSDFTYDCRGHGRDVDQNICR